jgi:hypothetical protein
MVFRFLLILFLTLPWFALAATSSECESALKTLFAEKVPKEKASEFLKLQGDLTLHRLAWAYLKAQKSDQGQSLENVERTILTLLDEKYTSRDPEFIKARDAFESQPLSRAALADIAPYLKDVLSHEFGKEAEPFVLNASDLKLLHALGKFEKKSATDGKYDSRMLARKSPEGMLNFATLINASYKTQTTPTEDALGVEVKLSGIEKTISGMQKRINDFVKNIQVPDQCLDQTLCQPMDMAELFNQNENIQHIFWSSLEDKLLSDNLLIDNLTYGELWLKVGSVSSSPVSSTVPQRQTVIGNKTKVSPVTPLKTYYTSSTGLLIDDPVAIIVKDGSDRKNQDWKGYQKPYLEAMSDAILNDDKTFTVDGKIFSRKTGRQLTQDQALALLPPQAREDLKKNLKYSNPKLMVKQITAKINGDKSFIHDGYLYNLDGKMISPEWFIANEINQKKGTKYDPSRYKGMDHGYLVARANSLINDKPHFVHKGQVYDSESGRNMSSPFRSVASTTDVKIDKQRRVQYQNLSDKETIVNFHRDNPKKDGCQHYAIVDKKNATMSVYTLAGVQVFSTEILLGKKVSDAKTRWTDYDDREQLASGTTGAGAFTIGQPKSNDYLKQTYSNNILQVEGQKVFAIHQVPNNLKGRYSAFGTGNPMDRRVSGGCVNLKQSDFNTLETWIKPTCKVYVLPEEPSHSFVVKDGELKFLPSTAVANANLYNYSTTKSSYHPIDIKIVNQNGKTADSVPFVNALEDEKSKLMKLFNLSNDDYNDLASVAYGIMGNESDFGRSTKYWIKEHDQGDVILAKAAKRLIHGQNPFDASVLNTSRGFTQIKDLPSGEWKKSYPGINKDTLGEPKNSAVATMAYLVDAVKVLKNVAKENSQDSKKVKITKENLVDYLGYIYQGRKGALKSAEDPANADFNTYVQKLRKNMSYIEIAQKIE